MPRSDGDSFPEMMTNGAENNKEWVDADDGGTYKDRARPGVVQARQTLGAVGRVASRVRTSGLLKVPSLIPKARDEDEEVSSSPWGVGTAAISRSQSVSVLPDDLARMRSGASIAAAAKRKSDLLDVSSPLSTDDIGLSAQKESEPKKGSKPVVLGNESRKSPGSAALQPSRKRDSGKPQRIEPGRALEKLASNVARPKFTFRPSLLVEATTACRDTRDSQETLKKSSSETFLVNGKRPEEEQKRAKGIHEENNTSVSSPVIRIGHQNENELPARQTSDEPQTNGFSDVTNSDIGRDTDKSMRFLQFVPFARTMSRHEGAHRRSRENCARIRPMFALTRGRSQALDSSPKGRGRSSQAKADTVKAGPQQPNELQSSRQQSSGSKTRRNVWKGLFTQNQQTGDGGKDKAWRASSANKRQVNGKNLKVPVSPDFFAKAAANKETNVLKAPRTDHVVSRVLKSPNALRSWKKSQGDIDAAEEDNLVLSDDDETTDDSIVRSLAVDDFITYQTRQTKKSQKGR